MPSNRTNDKTALLNGSSLVSNNPAKQNGGCSIVVGSLRRYSKQRLQSTYHQHLRAGGLMVASPYCKCCLLKPVTVKRCVAGLLILSLLSILYYTHYLNSPFSSLMRRDSRPEPSIRCAVLNGGAITHLPVASNDHRSAARLRIDPKVLVFVETTYSRLGKEIAELLVHNRMKYKVEVAGKSLPVLTNLDKGKYGVIVFENLNKYLNMDKWNRELLDKYCREYSVGIVGFVAPTEETLVGAQMKGFPLLIHNNLRLKDAALNAGSPILRLTRAGEVAWGPLPGSDWTVFSPNHSTYESLAWANNNSQDWGGDSEEGVHTPLTTVIQDHGRFDNIQRVFFGSGLKFWLHRLLFLDTLSYLSHGQLSINLNRLLLVDIDDIFVGEQGTRLRKEDVQALTEAQIEQVGKAMANMCMSSSGVQRSLITKAMNGEIEDDRKLKCFFGCIMEAVQVTKNGRMQPDILKRRANAMLPKSMREMILPTIDSCSHHEHEDKCELAYSIVKCHFEVNGKNPFFFNF